MSPPILFGLAALAAFFWGANFNLAGLVLVDMAPMDAAAWRFILAALVMAAVTIARREGAALLLAIRLHGWRLAVIGVVGIAGFNILFFDAMRSIPAVTGALVMAANPLLTALLAALALGERLPRRQIAAMPVAFVGVAVVILGKSGLGGELGLGWGEIEMVGACLVWAAYNVLTRKLMPVGPQFANVTVVMATGAAALALAAWIGGAPSAMPGLVAASALTVMAVFGSVLAYLFWSMAITGLGAGRTALFLNLVPVAAATISALGGSPPNQAQLIGGAVVILSVAYAMSPSKPAPIAAPIADKEPARCPT